MIENQDCRAIVGEMILFALFFISCRVRRLSMTQSLSCLLLSAESANNRLSSVQFGEKEEHYLSKIKKISWTKKKKSSFFDSNAQLILYITFHFFLFPSTFNLVYSRVSTAHLGQKEENNLSQKQKICKTFVCDACVQLLFFLLFLSYFIHTSIC